jgi:hypothetical protein
MMIVFHLKSGCPEQSLESSGESCPLLKQQMPILARWIKDRHDEGVPFIVLGDFNRVFSDQDQFWQAMNLGGEADLARSTAGHTSPCWAGSHPKFIDHIVFGGATRDWMRPSTFKVLVYDEPTPRSKIVSAITVRSR